MASSSSLILSLKVILISTGVLSLAMVMKYSIPSIIDFVVNGVPLIWFGVLSWLKPPYLFVVINGIIITIAACSKFYHKLEDERNQSEPLVSAKPPSSDLRSDFATVSAQTEFGVVQTLDLFDNKAQVQLAVVESSSVYESEDRALDLKPVVVNGSSEVGGDEDEDSFVLSRSTYSRPQRIIIPEAPTEFLFPAKEKPLVSSRFGHRKSLKFSPDGGRALRVAKPKRHETLETTWMTITDGRHVPLTRHSKKSDTWENRIHHLNVSPLEQSPQKVVTSDRTNYDRVASSVSPSPTSGKIRKEPSLSQDELHRRVEAFIKKFNEEMRLQRQESLKQYREMINRGAH